MRRMRCEGAVLEFREETRMDQIPVGDIVAAIERVQDPKLIPRK